MSFAAHSVPPERDLFEDDSVFAPAAPREADIAAARARLAAADAAVRTARERYRLAPHGGHGARLKALQDATHEALAAYRAYRQAAS